MKRTLPGKTSAAKTAALAQPSPEHAALALREARTFMVPVAVWLLRHGVSFPAFAELLKGVFVDASRGELESSGSRPTQSALSVLSGVHRKDVRTLDSASGAVQGRGRPPLSSQVFTRWLTDARYRDGKGKPKKLPRAGAALSFDGLCRELSNDVHPRAVLDELVRFGLVTLEGTRVMPVATSFVPSERLDEMTRLFSSNVADHIAAAVTNLTSKGGPFLEQSVFADGLTAESAEILHQVARRAWAQAFDTVVGQARQLVEGDMDTDGNHRVRFGTYFFSDPQASERPAPSSATDPRAPSGGGRPVRSPSVERRRARQRSRTK